MTISITLPWANKMRELVHEATENNYEDSWIVNEFCSYMDSKEDELNKQWEARKNGNNSSKSI